MAGKGFTLIEMIVVVIIIGILSAIALPMYHKSVERSRISDAQITLKAIQEAQERYAYEHDAYATTAAELDIDYADTSRFWQFSLNSGSTPYNADDAEAIATANRLPDSVYGIRINELGEMQFIGDSPPVVIPGHGGPFNQSS